MCLTERGHPSLQEFPGFFRTYPGDRLEYLPLLPIVGLEEGFDLIEKVRSQVVYMLHVLMRVGSNGNRYQTIVAFPPCIFFLLFGLDRSN
jgi:hypothetical protein